ncbi:NUMOD3 domain-containing DNA-binding protein [uncultured Rikenella sp.]|uniref:NUMOD3 domain-containing DNA-binding protein n=1 Tax=uncultured Rikenella sp. TaxID=368003 RepID=UPI00261B4D26|nr:NUMOD3 domain-containing DNA-binding protein [uncultured Rikenella sp.]
MTKEEYLKKLEVFNYTVYMHKNKINGKVYIGITKRNPKYRWNNGKGYYNQVFKKAIDIYGWDNFEHIILFTNLSKEEAEQKEIELIKKYNSSNSKYGYNISKGGLVNNGVPCKEETKRKISVSNKGEKNGMYHKKHTENSLIKISNASKKLWQNEEHKKKMSEKMKGNAYRFKKGNIPWNKGKKCKPAINRKKVQCIETGEIFNSIAEAEKIKNTNNISCCCSGKRKSTKGYHWRYYEE